MKIEKIKPIQKYIIEKIKQRDKKDNIAPNGYTRFYAYLTTNDKELVKVTVAVKHKYLKWYCKQVAVHGIHSEECFVKDIAFGYLSGYTVGWYSEGLTNYPKWFEYDMWDYNDDKLFDPYAPVINKEYIAKFPEYKYSAYDLYNSVDILQYLRLYEKYPQTEYLLKLGISPSYVTSKQILKKVEKDKKFRQWLSLNRLELRYKNFCIPSILQAFSKNKPIKEVDAFNRAKKELQGRIEYIPIRELFKKELEIYFKYIGKQKITNGIYLDYLNACNYLGLDMNEDKNRFPHDFKRWHDIRTDEYSTAKAIKDEEERKELYTKFALVADKYSLLQYDKKSDFCCIIAKSPADLVREGKLLHHCVGRMGYDQKFVREETLIFFIRTQNLPDTPLVTLEYSIEKKKVLQCYAEHNTKPDNEVMQYINKVWLPYANRTLKKIAV